jgi:ribosomal protein S6
MKSKKSDRRLYECVLVTTNGEIDNIISSVLKSLQQSSLVDSREDVTSSCSILHRQSWAKRTFAYKIRGWKKGYYSAIYLSATPESLDNFTKSLKMNQDVLRFLLVLVKSIPTSLPKIALEEVENN